MLKCKSVVLWIAALISIFIGMEARSGEILVRPTESETLVATINYSSWVKDTCRVSPDSKRVAYVARVVNKWFVVVDGKEEKQYDLAVLPAMGGRIVFDSPDSLHYLAVMGSNVYMVKMDFRP